MKASDRGPGAARTAPPLQRSTLANLTLLAIRERILSGTYPEGEPLRQDAVADELGVSRIPVREALRQLEAEGLVSFHPHRGAVVSSLSLDEIEEVFSLRAVVESSLLRTAVPRLQADDLARAEEVLTRYDQALAAHDVVTYGELNWQFHSTLYAPAERPITMGIVQRLHQQADRYLRMQLALTHSENRASQEHGAILEAARRHEVDEAATLLKRHIRGAGRLLVKFLRAHRATIAASTGRVRTAPSSSAGSNG